MFLPEGQTTHVRESSCLQVESQIFPFLPLIGQTLSVSLLLSSVLHYLTPPRSPITLVQEGLWLAFDFSTHLTCALSLSFVLSVVRKSLQPLVLCYPVYPIRMYMEEDRPITLSHCKSYLQYSPSKANQAPVTLLLFTQQWLPNLSAWCGLMIVSHERYSQEVKRIL